MNFNERRDDGQWHHMLITCTLLEITTLAPHHSVFYRPYALPDAQRTVSEALKANFFERNRKLKRYILLACVQLYMKFEENIILHVDDK